MTYPRHLKKTAVKNLKSYQSSQKKALMISQSCYGWYLIATLEIKRMARDFQFVKTISIRCEAKATRFSIIPLILSKINLGKKRQHSNKEQP